MTPVKYFFQMADLLTNLVNLEEFSTPIPPPYYSYKPFQEPVFAGDGHVKGIGFPSLEWRWSSLTLTQRDYLRDTFCPGESADVVIATLTPDSGGEYLAFEAILVWPVEELVDNDSVIDFTLTFTHLVDVTTELYP